MTPAVGPGRLRVCGPNRQGLSAVRYLSWVAGRGCSRRAWCTPPCQLTSHAPNELSLGGRRRPRVPKVPGTAGRLGGPQVLGGGGRQALWVGAITSSNCRRWSRRSDSTPTSMNRGAAKRMDTPTTYFHWGFILISVPNLLVIAGMIVLFAIALVIPFPHTEAGENDHQN